MVSTSNFNNVAYGFFVDAQNFTRVLLLLSIGQIKNKLPNINNPKLTLT
jgi:hypothetical protein